MDSVGTMAHPGARGERHVDHIDGLRAVAVLAVIAYHMDSSWVPGGFSGVDVFFVISGFVVSGSLARAGGASLWAFLVGFYARRIRRIAPALVVCLLVTGLVSALFIPQAWLSNTNDATGLRAFLGISNFFLLDTAGDYFAPRVDFNPYTHTWSLGVEEQFYLVFPLLFFAWVKAGPRRVLAMGALAVAVVASLVYAARIQPTDPNRAFYMLTARFWELGAGALLFQAMSLRPGVVPARVAAPGALAAAAALLAGLWLARGGQTPWPDGLLPVAGTVGLLLFLPGVADGHPVRWVLQSRAAVAIGLISYSLYLWHWSIFVLFRWTAGLEGLAIPLALGLTFAAAVLSYRYVEKPFRTGSFAVRAPRLAVVGVGLASILVLAGVFRTITHSRDALSLSVIADHQDDWYGSRLTSEKKPGARRIFVLGDSHALAYEPMFALVEARGGWDVDVRFQAGCAVLNLRPQHRPDPGCRAFAKAALRGIGRTAKPGDVLFLPSLRVPRIAGERGADIRYIPDRLLLRVPSQAARRRVPEQQAVAALGPIVRRGVHVVFEAPTPLFRAHAYRCSDWFNRGNPSCEGGLHTSRAALDALRRPVLDSFTRIRREVPEITVWDPFPQLCPGDTCHALRDGRPLFFDGDHLSGYANRLLAPSFLEHVRGPAGTAAPA